MKTTLIRLALSLSSVALLALSSPAGAAVDADAANALAKKEGCFKCHAVDKTKKGPSFKKTATKFKGKTAEGEKEILTSITTGPKVKLEDGSEETHKVIETKDKNEINNLIQWILAQ
jgi:cytochrome c